MSPVRFVFTPEDRCPLPVVSVLKSLLLCALFELAHVISPELIFGRQYSRILEPSFPYAFHYIKIVRDLQSLLLLSIVIMNPSSDFMLATLRLSCRLTV
jgi:hypothetical protein